MKTPVLMQREIFGETIQQNSKTQFFSATDLAKVGNKWRMINGLSPFNLHSFLSSKGTLEFIEELEKKYNQVIVRGRGRGAHTWVHPLLFIDIALGINPKLKVEVYEWLFDNLIKYRNDSGDSYKQMSSAIFIRHRNHKTFPDIIKRVSNFIRAALKVEDWQKATEVQLKQRDQIHVAITLYSKVLTNVEQITRLAVKEILELNK